MSNETYTIVTHECYHDTIYIIRDDKTGKKLQIFKNKDNGKISLEANEFPETSAYVQAQKECKIIEKNKKYYDEKYLIKSMSDIGTYTTNVPDEYKDMYNYVLDKFNLRYSVIDLNKDHECPLEFRLMDEKFNTIKFKCGQETVAIQQRKNHLIQYRPAIKLKCDHFIYNYDTGRFKLRYNKIDPVLYNISINKAFNRYNIDYEDIDKCPCIIPEDKEIMKEIYNAAKHKRPDPFEKDGIKYLKK